MLIRVAHIVKETFTNQAGNDFYLHLKEVLKKGETIEISFKDTLVPSSSFLNSSFGSLIEDIGLQNSLNLIKPRKLAPTQDQMLKHYIQGFKSDSTKH
jgi:hypothetical protein